MERTRKLLIIGAAAAALAAGGAGTAIAVSGNDDGEPPATGSGADRARTAALEITKGGTANAVERDSENGATWEVEITGEDGKTVDVRLDENYKVVVVEGDGEDSSGE
jgi:hypothetical protein